MPMVGGRNWRGEMVGFNGPLEVDDGDEAAVAWARGWLNQGATLVEDVKTAKAKAESESPPEPPLEPEPPVIPAVEPAGLTEPAEPTLAELRAEADRLDLPTYGTKAQLAERIAARNADLGQQAEQPNL